MDPGAIAEAVSTARRQRAVANLAEPGVQVLTTVVLADDRVLGYCNTLPIELWDGRVTHPGYWVNPPEIARNHSVSGVRVS